MTTFHAIYVKPKREPWIKTEGVPTGTLWVPECGPGLLRMARRESLGWIV